MLRRLAALAALLAATATLASNPGERVPAVSFMDLAGRSSALDHPQGKSGTVLITRDIECPVSQRYERRIAELAKRYGPSGYDFVIIDVTPHDIGDARKAAAKLPGTRTVLADAKALAKALRFESTAEAFVIDAGATLQYRGAIDDQYGLDYQRPLAREPWLARALDAVTRGERPQVTRTKARGCPQVVPQGAPLAAAPLTYHNRISRIVQAKCQVCHRTGGLAPMPLETFRQVYERRAVIELMVSTNRMPPWPANRKVGHFANDRSLAEREREELLGWIKAGGAEGNPGDAPLPQRFASGWNIGKPDHILRIPEPFQVPAEGAVDYKNYYIKTDFPVDKWVTAIEIKPTQPKVVHHALAFLEEPGRRALTPEELAKLNPGDPRPPAPSDSVSGFYAVTVPGSLGITFPEGMGKRLPKGAWIKLEIHYQPNGSPVIDRTQIGFRFASGPLREVESRSAFNVGLVIPPNAPRYEVKAEHKFDQAGLLLSLFPHMHFRGAAFRYDLRYPDGKVVPLLDVPRFDFSWQSYYLLSQPLDVPRGSTLLATAWYDNSRANPWNPDPSKTIRWGLQTTDEMMIGYFDFAVEKGASRKAVTPGIVPR